MPRYWGERLAGVVFIAISLYVGDMALEFPAGGGTFPIFSVACAILLSLALIARTFVAEWRDDTRADLTLTFDGLKPLIMTALVILYVLVIFELGYFTATLLFLVAAALLIGIRKARTIAITAIVLLPSMYAFFEVFLQAQLPTGVLL